MKRTIAIVAGGDTSEYEVSLRSAQGIYSFLDKDKYNPYIVVLHGTDWHVRLDGGGTAPIDRNDFSFTAGGRKTTFDYAYIIIHGTPGEDGCLQGYFDMLHLPYSGCGVLASSMTYDKFVCNQYLRGFGVRIAESLLLRRGQHILTREPAHRRQDMVAPAYGGRHTARRSHKAADPGWSRFISALAHKNI